MCEGDGCETEEKIREWLAGKYIILLYNQIRFNSNEYFYSSAIKESRIAYIPISSQVRQIIPNKIKRTSLELQDYLAINLDELTMIPMSDLFRLEKQELLPYERPDNIWVSVTVEMDLDMV